ncbi:Phox (PX) domain-containing protein [Euphorbia peplus]|nr:Phox (PX) domain-containing protein [Euphorbia peplus]
MINGDGPQYRPPSPDPLDPKFSDADDVSPGSHSRYSSCGGESEFDRYCSANSVMGTPSLCSSFGHSNDRIDFEFGSLKSFDNFSLDEPKRSALGFDCLKESVKEPIVKNWSSGGDSISNGIRKSSSLVRGFEEGSSSHVVNEGGDGLDSELGLDVNGSDMESEDDGTISRYGGSEDDHSMYGCGSDDENRKELYRHKNIQRSTEKNVMNENPLLMSSSVAFGAEDWDDFEQERGNFASMTLDDSLQMETHRSLCDFTATPSREESTAGLSDIEEDIVTEPSDDMANLLVKKNFSSSSVVSGDSRDSELKQAEKWRDIKMVTCPVQGTLETAHDDRKTSVASCHLPKLVLQYARENSAYNLVQDANCTSKNFESCINADVLEMEKDPFVEKLPVGNIVDWGMETECISVNSQDITPVDNKKNFETGEAGSSEAKLDPLSGESKQLCPSPIENGSAQFAEDQKLNTTKLMLKNSSSKVLKKSPTSVDAVDNLEPVKEDKVERNEFYDDFVNEMEEILLDSSESPGARFPQVNLMSQSQLCSPRRDGGSTASTSGTDAALLITQPLKVDGIEVVGAKQKKGDVSLGERLVGVKEYTVYRIRVCSGNEEWEVERRYRDFFTLYRRLKSLFTDQGWTLPLPWSSVEKESRKMFGNASPAVVSERSVLIQECLSSIIHSGHFSSLPTALFWFLCPQDSIPSSPASPKAVPWSIFSNRAADQENVSTLGKTISLIVEIRPYKSTKQLLEAQHYTCAGCHKHFDDGMTLVQDFVQALGWGKPRLCEYTGQLFCSSCHTNETAVLPARVLHYWDFTQYPVSQLAKSYLDSIHEQPMLCVSAVNPFLFSKVPALQQIMSVRKKIGTMLPYVHCPFRRTVNKGLGLRRYLLESNDFFALRDLIDLSKGAFAALPVMVETVSRKILEHITDQCLVCCDVGIPCSARQACNDPSSLIFPFQEGEVEKCSSCPSVFHKTCFRKLTNCSCGAVIGEEKSMGVHNKLSRKASDIFGRSGSGLSVGLLSGLFSRANPEKVKDHKDNDTVILMGSLPSTYL